MNFSHFYAAIQSDALKHVAAHWHEARGPRRLPAWHDILPSHIASQLKLIWVYKYDHQTQLFTGRLAGNMIESVFGKSFRGTPMKELYPELDYPRLHARAQRVVSEPALFRGQGKVFRHLERIGNGERIMLPLSDDGLHGDGVMGATIYQMAHSDPSPQTTENESWYAV